MTERLAVDYDELVRNMMIVARTNGWLGDIIKWVDTSEGEKTDYDIAVVVLGRASGLQKERMLQTVMQIEGTVRDLVNFRILVRSKEGTLRVSRLARKYWDRFEPVSEQISVN